MRHQKLKAGKTPAGDHITPDVLKADKIPLHMSYIHTLMIPGGLRGGSQRRTNHSATFPMKATQVNTRTGTEYCLDQQDPGHFGQNNECAA